MMALPDLIHRGPTDTTSESRQMLFTIYFWRLTLERCIKSAAQFGLVAFGADATNIVAISPGAVLGAAAAGFVISALTSIYSVATTGNPTPSIVPPPAGANVVPVKDDQAH